MTLSLIPVLTVFVLLALSGGAYFLGKRTGIPHTVILVMVGVLLVLLAGEPGFGFLASFELTPSLLFYIFLPTLIFESAYNLNIRRLTMDAIPVTLLSIASLLISALAIAGLLVLVMPFFGIELPFAIAFVFGSLISATDPVAVLALFKEYGAPRRLALLFEGESLFNDGTAFALFLVALEFVAKGGLSAETLVHGILSFTVMLVGGALFGLILGGIFAKAIGYARSNESVGITLMLVMAHATFLLSELVSSEVVIAGFEVHLSSIIAATVAAMVVGNYGRAKLPAHAEEFVERFWGQIAFFANSLVFILIGTLAAALPLNNPELFWPVVVAALIVAFSRALSIYPVIVGWNAVVDPFRRIPMAWQHLLSWGSLRGALAVTMALLIPTDLAIPGWTHDYSVFDLLLAFTTGCIFVTLFLKATTIGPLMRKLGADKLGPLEAAEYEGARAHIYGQVFERIADFEKKGYMSAALAESIRNEYRARFETALAVRSGAGLEHAALRVFMLGIERHALTELYYCNEITEPVYKRILAKLDLRIERAERGLSTSEIHLSPANDIFEWAAGRVRALFPAPGPDEEAAERYMYYRALSIIARKALKELAHLSEGPASAFSPEALAHTRAIYEEFRTHARHKMQAEAKERPELGETLARKLATCAAHTVEERALGYFDARRMITPKVSMTLRDEFAREQDH